MLAPYAVTSEELRERAYEAFARGDWTMGRRLAAKADVERAKAVHGPCSKEALEATKRFTNAIAKALQLEIGR